MALSEPGSPPAPDAPLLPSLRAAVARVTCEGGVRGTAFLIDPQHALTALHVVGDRRARPVELYRDVQLDFSGHLTAATVVAGAFDPDADWALLRLASPPRDAEGRPVTPLPLDELGEDELQQAEQTGGALPFRSRGYPDANPDDGLDVGGQVRTTLGQVAGVPALQLYSVEASAGTGAPVSGLSGAPVLVAGAVVGLLRTAILDGDGRSMAGALFACPARTVLKALLAAGGPPLQLHQPACPYPGMVSFARHQSSLFFGRSGEIDWLLQHLRKQRFALVLGPSGSGKSSLVSAGLLPRLPAQVVARTMRPGDQPERELAAQLGGDAAPVLTGLGPEQRFLLFIDQLEELFARCPRPVQQRFLARLQGLRDDPRVTLVLALRADFYPDLMNSALWPIDPAQRLEVAPLRGAALASAIAGPAAQAGVRLEPLLLERLVADAADEPGALPLLQETMVLLWERRERRRLTLAAYEQLGQTPTAGVIPSSPELSNPLMQKAGGRRSGLAVAIASHAEGVYAMLARSPQQQALARRIFVRLVHFGEGRPNTRRQLPRSALQARGDDPAAFAATLELLASQRLITQSVDDQPHPETDGEAAPADAVRVDLSHEIILRAWPRLLGWLAEKKQAERVRRRLEDQAAERQRLRQQGYGLLDGAETKEAEDWLAGPDAADVGVSAAVAELIADSRRAVDWEAAHSQRLTRRWQWAALLMLGVACVAAVAAAGAVREYYTAEAESRNAQQQAALARAARQQAHAQARTATGQLLSALSRERLSTVYDQALLLAVGGQRLHPGADADASLLTALAQAPGLRRQLLGHDGQVSSVAVSPDGRLVATGCTDGYVRLFEAASGRLLSERSHAVAGLVSQVAFSADSARLISAGTEGTLRVWDARPGETCGQPIGQPLPGHDGEIKALAVSPDGRLFASGGDDMTIRLWDAVTGLQVGAELRGHKATVAGLAFGPDSRQLASVSFDKTVRLWAPRSGQALPAPAAAQKVSYPLRAVAYSPKGGLLAFAGGDGSDAGVQILSLDAGATRPRSATATKIVSSLAYSPDGRQLAAGTWDRQVLLLPTDGSGATSTLRSPGGAVLAVAYAPSGEWLASATEYSGLFLWSPQPTPALQLGSVRADNGQALTSLAVSPDGKLLVAGGVDKAVHRFARTDGQLRELRPLTGAPDVVAAVALSPDGQRLAAATGNEVRLFRADNGQPLGQPLGHKGVVVAVAFDPSSSRLAASTFDGDLQLWNVTDGQPLGPPLRGHTQAVWGLAFSRDGSRLCSASQDVTLRIWDSGRGTELAQVGKGHALALTACAFSPRGDLVVTASEDSTLRVWEIDEPPPPPPPSAAQANAPRASISGALAVRPRGEPLRGHAGKVRQLAISADGQRVLSVGEDQQLRLWDLPTQTLIGAIGDSPALLNAVALLPGDQQAATVGEDGALRLWQLDAGAWARLCCQRAGRDLSPREQALFLGGLQDLGKEPLGRLCAQE